MSVLLPTAEIPKPNLLQLMKQARIWLLWKSVSDSPEKKPRKIPFYVDGKVRSGQLDGPDDLAKLVTYAEAASRFDAAGKTYAGLAIALCPDASGYAWQGLDFDDIVANGLGDIADLWTSGDYAGYGYVEQSPSELGLHIIGYGKPFAALGSNGSGIEAYSGARFFTFTGKPIVPESPCLPCDLADFVETVLRPRHGKSPTPSTRSVDTVVVDPKTLTELRSALTSLRADDRDLWIKMGMALRELGEVGRGLWLDWSQSSTKFEPLDAAKVWDSLKPSNTGYAAVFAEAQRQGWLNPASNAAREANTAPVKTADSFQDRVPRDFISSAIAPPLDISELPPPIGSFAAGYSAAHGFDRSGVALAAIAAAAAMLDDGFVLEAKPGWHVSARIWAVLVGRSATGKSPTIKAATSAVKAKHSEVVAAFRASYEPDPDQPLARPPEPALYTSDSTIEALSEKLKDNERGMLMITEEFASWIGPIDSGSRGDAAKNRGAWLQLYDGGPYQVDRIIRGSFEVPNWGASLLTATTPTALAQHMKNLPEDGLIQRFIPVILAPRDFEADGDASPALNAWRQALTWVFDNVRPATVRFSPEARQLFRAIEVEMGRAASAMDGVSPALASHLGKHSEMVARLALIFHAFSAPGSLTLSAETLQKSADLIRQIRRHSVALFNDILGRSPTTDVARALARSLAAANPAERSIGRNWMTQHCRDFARTTDDRTRRAAVQLLEDLDWLKDAGKKPYGGWPSSWEVNQNIYRLYAREGEMHRAQREAVQAVFADMREGDEAPG